MTFRKEIEMKKELRDELIKYVYDLTRDRYDEYMCDDDYRETNKPWSLWDMSYDEIMDELKDDLRRVIL